MFPHKIDGGGNEGTKGRKGEERVIDIFSIWVRDFNKNFHFD